MMQHLSKHFILIFDFFKNHDGKEPIKKEKKSKHAYFRHSSKLAYTILLSSK